MNSFFFCFSLLFTHLCRYRSELKFQGHQTHSRTCVNRAAGSSNTTEGHCARIFPAHVMTSRNQPAPNGSLKTRLARTHGKLCSPVVQPEMSPHKINLKLGHSHVKHPTFMFLCINKYVLDSSYVNVPFKNPEVVYEVKMPNALCRHNNNLTSVESTLKIFYSKNTPYTHSNDGGTFPHVISKCWKHRQNILLSSFSFSSVITLLNRSYCFLSRSLQVCFTIKKKYLGNCVPSCPAQSFIYH